MFINKIFIMYNPDISSIIKYHYISEDKLPNAEISFLDFSEKIDVQEDSSVLSTISPLIYTKSLSNEIIKRGFISNTVKIFEEIIDKYYELCLEFKLQNEKKDDDIIDLKYNTKHDINELYRVWSRASNIISKQSRFGPSNVIIVPDKNYKEIFERQIPNNKIIINPTEHHKDKIFVIRINNELGTPGLSLFITKNIETNRYLKLMKIMKKIGKHIDDLSFSYIISNVGYHSEKFVQCIHLIND